MRLSVGPSSSDIDAERSHRCRADGRPRFHWREIFTGSIRPAAARPRRTPSPVTVSTPRRRGDPGVDPQMWEMRFRRRAHLVLGPGGGTGILLVETSLLQSPPRVSATNSGFALLVRE
jgi:hypothetical protein